METNYDLRSERRQKAGGYQPTTEEQAALRCLNDHFKPDEPVKRALEQQWITNIAFLRGYQYMNWDPVQRTLVFTQTPSLRWKSRLPNNLCRPYVRQAVSQIGSFRPKFKGRPATNDPEDYQSAETAEKVVEHYWDLLKMQPKRWELLHWMKTTGNCFIKVIWNPRGGDPISSDPTFDEDQETDEESEYSGGPLYEGEMESEIRSPFVMYADPFADSPEQVRWLIECAARPIEWVEQNFPDRASLVRPGINSDSYQSRRRWLVGSSTTAGYGESPIDDADKNWVIVKEYWERPSLDYPNGRLIIEANGVILRTGDNPTPNGRLPYIWIRDEIVPGMLWGQCDLDNMIPLQRIYNRLVNKQVEHVVNTANAKALQHSSNEINESQWATETEVITWHGVTPPSWLAPPPLGADVQALSGEILQNFDRVSSSYGPARGQYQGKISGKAYMSLIEQDIQSKSPTIERLSEGFSDWARLVLVWVRQYVTETRMVNIVGRDKQFDVSEFKGSDIGSNTDVRVDVESMMPKSKAMALEMLQYLAPGEKWLSGADPQDKARVFRMLALEDDGRVVQDKSIDEREARLENRRMMMGAVIESAKPHEDHEIHMMLHNEMRKSDEYKSADPIIKMIVDAHCNTHLQIVMPQVGVTLPPQEETFMEGPDMPQRGGMPGQQMPPQQRPPTLQPMT